MSSQLPGSAGQPRREDDHQYVPRHRHRAEAPEEASPAHRTFVEPMQERDNRGKAAVAVEKKKSPSVGARVLGVVGELLITAGLIVGLYIVWSLWWTDVMANADQSGQVADAQKAWVTEPEKIGAPRTDTPPAVDHPTNEGALLGLVYIPEFGSNGVHTLKQGVGLEEVLDTGSYGHYENTQYAGEQGNFAISAHRQTYGAALRDVDKLKEGDPIVIQTPQAYFVYHVVKHEIVTPTTIRVLDPDPFNPGGPATDRYLTMTTCDPPFVSNMRWITYAKLDHWVDPSTGIPQEIKDMKVN